MFSLPPPPSIRSRKRTSWIFTCITTRFNITLSGRCQPFNYWNIVPYCAVMLLTHCSKSTPNKARYTPLIAPFERHRHVRHIPQSVVSFKAVLYQWPQWYAHLFVTPQQTLVVFLTKKIIKSYKNIESMSTRWKHFTTDPYAVDCCEHLWQTWLSNHSSFPEKSH